MIEEKLSGINNVNIYIYEPTVEIREVLKKERVRLTDGRALLLYVLYDLVRHGEYVSEFSSEKACYFLQKFGAKKYLNLIFTPNFYGPYSGKVRYVLNALNGSYVMGYSAMDKKPFAPLTLVADGYDDVIKYINNNKDLKDIAYKTTSFLAGFYSDFTLELLSSIDYLIAEHGDMNRDKTYQALANWNNRKRSMFSNLEYIDTILNHLQTNNYSNYQD